MIISIIVWIIFGAIAGWVASRIMKTREGMIANIIVGIVGAFIGGFISRMLGGPGVSGFNITSLIVAILGAVILLFFVRIVSGGSRSRHGVH
ncbi:MAG: GlsB/YeaQ/YmgE family stress response membrane protein [Candidatus Saccharimonadales bacterium]